MNPSLLETDFDPVLMGLMLVIFSSIISMVVVSRDLLARKIGLHQVIATATAGALFALLSVNLIVIGAYCATAPNH